MDKLPNIHPGEVLKEEFLTPMGITPYRLAKALALFGSDFPIQGHDNANTGLVGGA